LLKGKNGEAYNIADESSNITIKELAEMVAKIGNRKMVIDLPDETEKQGFNVVTKSLYSTEKLRSLGWTCDGSMFEKMKSTIEVLQV
jgi:nucleoside-diphosphate-sugar epimerase